MERRSAPTLAPSPFASEELVARRRRARKQAWGIALVILMLYAGGFLVTR